MKVNPKLLILVFLVFLYSAKAQDKNKLSRWTYKAGGKCNLERTACKLLNPGYNASVSDGVQFIIKDKKSIWSFQTGINKSSVRDFYVPDKHYNYLQLPLTMRIDKFGFYFLGGVFIDYLYQIKNPDYQYNLLKTFSPGITHALGYEGKIISALSFFVEMRHFEELGSHINQLGFSSYGFALGLNCRLN